VLDCEACAREMSGYNRVNAASDVQNIARCKRVLKDIWTVEAARKSVRDKREDNSTSAEDRGPENIRIPASLIELQVKYRLAMRSAGHRSLATGVTGRTFFADLPGINCGCHPRQESFRVSVIPWAGTCQALLACAH
jgi:hypothetical protein